jgi:DNA-binding FadR family transcriptional regulator
MQPHETLVLESVASAIAAGEYRAGARLPAERDLAARLQVSRSAVRTALAILERDGQVSRRIGSGTYVLARPPAAARIDASPAQIMDARFLLEPRLAQLAVVNATAADFARIEAMSAGCDGTDDFAAFEQWDAALHQAIAEATHNGLVIGLYGMITGARDLAEWGDLKRQSLTAERRDLYRLDHRRIVAALRARDAGEAEAMLLEHLRHVRQNLLGY